MALVLENVASARGIGGSFLLGENEKSRLFWL